MEHLKALKELCETLSKELEKSNDKIRAAGGSITPADLEYIDKLTHSIKSVKTTIAMIEGEGDMDLGPYMKGGYAMRGRPEYIYRSPKRDSMGRYSRDRAMLDELYDLMERAPDEMTRQEMHRMIQRLESM